MACSFVIIVDLGVSGVGGDLVVSLLNKGLSDTLKLWKSNDGLLVLSDDENVGETSGEGVASGILDVDDLVGTWMVLNVHEGTNTTDIVSTLDEDGASVLALDDSVDFAGLEVQLDGVVLLDFWVGEADGSSVVGHNIRDSVLSEGLSLDLAELEAGFLTFDADGLETSLDIVEDAEVLVGLGDLNDVLETEWELGVSSDLAINLDQTFSLSADFDRFLAGESVFKSVLEKDGQWDALTELVGSSRWAVGVHTSQFVQAPGGWCEHSLQMLFGSSCHFTKGS